MLLNIFTSFVVGIAIGYTTKYIKLDEMKQIKNALEKIGKNSWYETFNFYQQMFRLKIEQYFNESCVPFTQDYYLLKGIIDGKLYCVIIKPERGPSTVESIYALKETPQSQSFLDKTEELEPYIRSFNSIVPVNADIFGYKRIIIND